MKVLLIVLAMVACLTGLAVGIALAHEGHAAAAKTVEYTGELVDIGCYVGHTAKGEKHSECAAKCIAGGMPMGLLSGNGRLFLLTMDHANPDAYNNAKKMAGKRVKISGPVHEKSGISTIDVVTAEIASAPATATK
ncbi:MAG TPA: hypothetical protein VGQ14_02980 [Candidatus Eisenbacteria bacterium]|jgi:hypothetical protein|nr:hypothetical protein [Candidatus Eisenbacteria bacterium]